MNIYSARRERLMKSFNHNAAVIVFSGKEIMKSEDEAYDYDVNRNFYYLTGLQRADMTLLMFKIDDVVREMVFALPYSEYAAKWFGGRMPFEEIEEISGVQSVMVPEELDSMVASVFNRTRRDTEFSFYLDMWQYTQEQDPSLAVKYANKLKAIYPAVKVNDLYPLLTKMRLVKDEYEIACIKQAIAITKVAQESMMRGVKPEMNELMMEAIFDYSLKSMGCNKRAFTTICASGENATVLHYHDNNCQMKHEELFLCDMGATFKNYCADISRTFPISGYFTDRQREIYEVVLQAQKIVQENAKPGVKTRELNNMVIEFYKEELPKHGLYKDVSEYYFHGVSHHLGLDTHDVDGGLGATLAAGNVITNEPGLYISDEKIGIRIEDDLLITEDGCINLAADLIKEVDDIHNFMANR